VAAPSPAVVDDDRETSYTCCSSPAFTSLFGSKFADFLRPDFESEGEEKEEEEVAPKKQEVSGLVDSDSLRARDIPSENVCQTVGGCLFEHGLCSYVNSQVYSSAASFNVTESQGGSCFTRFP
jgi:hypothetical protein